MPPVGLEQKPLSLSIPCGENLGSSHHCPRRILFVSEDQVVYAAGNLLQVTSVPTLSTRRDAQVLQKFSCEEPAADSVNAEPIGWSNTGRGFSCLGFDPRWNRLAYSPNRCDPTIIVKSLKHRPVCKTEALCILSNGASVCYADIAFSRDGYRIAAVGKGEVDAKLWVWQIGSQLSHGGFSGDSQNSCEGKLKVDLLVVHQLDSPCISCAFDPSDNNRIALLRSNGTAVEICSLSCVANDVQIDKYFCYLAHDDKTEQLQLTAFAWELDHQIMVGTSGGKTILFNGVNGGILDAQCSVDEHVTSYPESPVLRIIITLASVIIGFSDGTVQWRNRVKENALVTHEINLDAQLLDLVCGPDFEKFIALGNDGNLHSHFVDLRRNRDLGERTDEVRSVISNLHNGVITAITTARLAGKAGTALVVSGGLDGTVKIWRNTMVLSRYAMESCLTSLDVGSPVTALVSLEGSPVFAVGTWDGAIRFVHVARKKGSINSALVENGVSQVVMVVLKEETLCGLPVKSLDYNPKTKKIAAGCADSSRAFVICSEPNNLHVIGVAESPDSRPFGASVWCQRNPSHLFVGSIDGTVSCVDTMPMSFKPVPVTPIFCFRLSGIIGLQQLKCSDGFLYAIHQGSRGIESFAFPQCDTINPGAIPEIKRGGTYADGVVKRGSCLMVNSKAGIVVSGSLTGNVSIYEISSNGVLLFRGEKAFHSAAVIAIHFSAESGHLYTSSIDGSFFAHCLSGCSEFHKVPATHEYDYLVRLCI